MHITSLLLSFCPFYFTQNSVQAHKVLGIVTAIDIHQYLFSREGLARLLNLHVALSYTKFKVFCLKFEVFFYQIGSAN